MINIIDHAWQFELKDYSILPTVIKFAKNPPKSYFYSIKNRRVLRKKDQTLEASIQSLRNSQNPYQNYLLITQQSKSKIQFSFIIQSQLYELLINQSLNLAIIRLEQLQDKTLIVQCSFDLKGKVSVKLFWSSRHEAQINTTILRKYMLNLWKELPQIMKIQSKCQRIELILSISPSFDKIYLLWCNQFSFFNQQFYQIRYQYTIKEMVFEKRNQIKHKIQLFSKQVDKLKQQEKLELKQQNMIQSNWIQNQVNKSIQAICNGCGSQFLQQKGKQVPNSDIIGLRRRNKLSIMGILDQYLLVCQQCYYKIDQ